MAKYTSEQIAKIIIDSIEDAKKISDKNLVLAESILNSNQALENKLNNSTIKIEEKSIESFKVLSEKIETITQKFKANFNLFIFSIAFCLIGLTAFVSTFYFSFKTTSEIKNEYYDELMKEGKMLTNENEIFMKKYMIWKEKNPKDSNKFIDKVEAVKLE